MTRETALENAKPILFNTDMVRAILDGRKTVTRRIVKPQPDEKHKYILGTVKTETPSCGNVGKIIFGIDKEGNAGDWHYARPPYRQGDILFVRETWKPNVDGYSGIDFGGYVYKADCKCVFNDNYNPWKPSIHMPKDAARIFLKVKSVRVERLQEIDDEGAKAEGANCGIGVAEKMREDAIARFKRIWDSTIKKADLDTCGWKANPWVWVIEFEKLEVGE